MSSSDFFLRRPARGWVVVIGPFQGVLHLETVARCRNGSPREMFEAEVAGRLEAIERRDEVCERLGWALLEWQAPRTEWTMADG